MRDIEHPLSSLKVHQQAAELMVRSGYQSRKCKPAVWTSRQPYEWGGKSKAANVTGQTDGGYKSTDTKDLFANDRTFTRGSVALPGQNFII
jgi:hypothetical protein